MIAYSDLELQDPQEYYGGFKAAQIERWGDAERVSSDPWTGAWSGGSFRYRISDTDRAITRRKASPTERFWVEPHTVRMTNRNNRAQLGTPWTVWVGPIIDAQPDGLAWDITLGDIVSQRLLSDKHQLPYRMIRDGFLDQLDEINPDLDVDHPEQIIYGRHWRLPDIDPASPQGFVYTPPLLGKWTVSGTQYWVWMIAGHAVQDVLSLIIEDDDGVPIETFEGSDWLIPHHANHTSVIGQSYQDLVSSTFGTTRRYTLLYGVVGNTAPDEIADGTRKMAVTVSGIETVGDGTGALITDRFLQYKHFCINFIANGGANSYHTGPWLSNPTWSIFDADVPIVDSFSFDRCADIGVERLPDNDGYQGAAIIGARAGDQSSVQRWIADWNRSCGCRFAITHRGRIRIFLLHPTNAIKAAAPLFTDATEILDGSFSTRFDWASQATQIPFRVDYEYLSGLWRTHDVAIMDQAVLDYGAIPSDRREYPFAPGHTAGFHMAILEGRQRKDPPQVVVLEATIGPEPVTLESLGYLDQGEYIRYKSYQAVANDDGEIRLGQIIGHMVRVGDRKVQVAVLDCEDLIGFDAFAGTEEDDEEEEEEPPSPPVEPPSIPGEDPTEPPTDPPTSGTIFYASLSGSDSNPGTQLDPKRSIKTAVALATPGSTVYIRGGVYTLSTDVIDSVLNTVPSGTSWTQPVTIAGYPGETVIIRPPNGVHGLRLANNDQFILLQDLTLDYVNDTTDKEGSYISGGAHHIRHRRVKVLNCSNIAVHWTKHSGGFNEFLQGEVDNAGFTNGITTGVPRGYAFYISCGDNLIDGAWLHDCEGYAVHLYDNLGPFNVSRNIVRRCLMEDNGLPHASVFAVLSAWGSDNLVHSNILVGNRNGIRGYTNSFNFQPHNNTIVDSVGLGMEFQYYGSAPTARNNILWGNGTNTITDDGGTGSPVLSHNLEGVDPLFGANYALTASSPARDTGTTVAAVTVDYNGLSRPQGAAYCRGAKEYTP